LLSQIAILTLNGYLIFLRRLAEGKIARFHNRNFKMDNRNPVSGKIDIFMEITRILLKGLAFLSI